MLQLAFIPALHFVNLFGVLSIALLFLSPLFILISAALHPPQGRPYMATALILLFVGTAGLFLANSAAVTVDLNQPMGQLHGAGENLTTETKIVFAGLSIILSGIFLIPRLLRQEETRLTSTFLALTFLALYTVGIVLLLHTVGSATSLAPESGAHQSISPAPGDTSEIQSTAANE